MKQVKTAKGRIIDMGALAKANEGARAVGNMPMNAKGDRLDASGNVIATVQRVSRTQAKLATAPEKRKMSDAPGNKQVKAAPKPQTAVDTSEIVPEEPKVTETPGTKKAKSKAKAQKKATANTVVSEQTKTRDDGTSYIEIEYEDGSMETKELD